MIIDAVAVCCCCAYLCLIKIALHADHTQKLVCTRIY